MYNLSLIRTSQSSDQAQVVHSSLLKMPHNENAKVRLQAQPTPANISGVRLPKELSATQLAQLGQCPYKFILSSALGIKAQSHPSLWPSHREKGTVLHQALSQTVVPLYRPETLKTTLLAALELLNSTLSPISGRYTALIEDAKAMIPSFVKAQELRQEQGWQVYAVEHEQRYAEFFQELTLKAKPDRVDIHRQNQLTHYAVIDYKTSSQQTLQTKVKNTLSDAQLLLYTAALISEGKELTQALYWRLSDTSKPLIEMEVDADQIEPILNALEQAWNMLLSGEAAHAIPSELNCEYCDFAGVCRVKGESMDKDTQ